jgi:hypothetical protein
VLSVMTMLESMFDDAPAVGAYLMARLYKLAAHARDHETRMAIGLWIEGSKSNEVAEVLRKLASEGIRPMLVKRYLQWAEDLESSTQR